MTKLDINSASLEDLTNVDGIGERRARAIVAHREESGGFSSLDELLRLPYFDHLKAPDYDALKERLEIRSETIEARQGGARRGPDYP